MGSFECQREQIDEKAVDVVTLTGDLDSYSAPRLRDLLNELLDVGADRIVLDCQDLEYVDSSGLGTMVAALKQTSDRYGILTLARPNENVRRVLQITGLDRLFAIYEDVDRAREACVLQPA